MSSVLAKGGNIAALLTLLVHGTALVGGVGVVGGVGHLSIALVDHSTRTRAVLTRDRFASRLVSDGRKLGPHTTAVAGRRATLRRVRLVGTVDLVGLRSLGSGTLTLLGGLALGIFLLLPGLPLLADLLKFCHESQLMERRSGMDAFG